MRTGIIGRIAGALAALASHMPFIDLTPKTKAAPESTDSGRIRKPPKYSRIIRIFSRPDGKAIFGPAFIPEEANSHKSRQLCRARLRGLMFDKVSRLYPGLSRRDRRRHASLAARLEYRRMMKDTTNCIPDDEYKLFQRLESMEAA